jgi:16S rRNA (guanine527-N7)-methyltransferase
MIASEGEARDWIATLPEADPAALARLDRLAALLTAENERQNLIAAASLPHLWQRHIADSAQLLSHVPREAASPWLDLGTGAGFPGLVISALRPDIEVWLVESRAMRIAWLEQAVAELALPCTRVIGSRLELVPAQPMAVISARAFAPLERLLTLSARFSTADTLWLLPKGRSARDEVNRLSGWRHLFHVEQSLTDPEAGIVVGTMGGKEPPARKGRKA